MKKQKKFSPAGCALKLVVGAGCVIFWICLGLCLAQSFIPPGWQHPAVLGATGFALLVFGVELATVILSPGSTTPFGLLGLKKKDFSLRELQKKGLTVTEHYQATRCFEVATPGDAGIRYFIELNDGGVLYLEGQYLMDLAPITDDPEVNQPRSFPCSEFVFHLHRKHGYLVEIECRGQVLEPELTAPAFTAREYQRDVVPSDGDVITSMKYEEIKRQRLSPPL